MSNVVRINCNFQYQLTLTTIEDKKELSDQCKTLIESTWSTKIDPVVLKCIVDIHPYRDTGNYWHRLQTL